MRIAAFLQRILPPLWLGMVLATAMEAQLKFQAPGITRELALGIGKLVFTALNRAEIIIAILLLITFFVVSSAKKVQIVFSGILLILLAQTFWLIPNLVERIDLITGGQTPPDSPVHIFYIVFEIGKVLLLLVFSILLNTRKMDLKNEGY